MKELRGQSQPGIRPLVTSPRRRHLVSSGKQLTLKSDAIAVLKADLLLLQKRIDLLGFNTAPISYQMQESERFLMSIPTTTNAFSAEGADDHSIQMESKMMLLEAMIKKISQLCSSLLTVGKKSPAATQLLPVQDTSRQPSSEIAPPSARLVRPVSAPSPLPGYGGGKPKSSFSLSQPFGTELGPAGRESFLSSFIAFADAVAEASIENYRAMPSMNLEVEWRQRVERTEAKCAETIKAMTEANEVKLADQQKHNEAKMAALKTELQEVKDQLKSRDEKDASKLKGFVPLKDHQEELKKAEVERHKLTDEIASLHHLLTEAQDALKQQQETQNVAFEGVQCDKLIRELGLPIQIPTLIEIPNIDFQVSDKNLKEAPTPKAGGKGAKKEKELSPEQQLMEKQKTQIQSMSTYLHTQNQILIQLQEKVPEILADRDRRIAELSREVELNKKRMLQALEDNKGTSTKMSKLESDYKVANQTLQAELDAIREEQKRQHEEVAHDHTLLKTLPIVAHADNTPPPTIVAKVKGQQAALARKQKHMAELQATLTSSQGTVEDLQQEITSLKGIITELEKTVGRMQTEECRLYKLLDDKNIEIDDLKRMCDSLTHRLNESVGHSTTATERAKLLDIHLHKQVAATEEVEAQLANLQSRYDALMEQKDEELAQQRQKMQQEIDQCREAMDGQQNQLAEAENKISELKATVQGLKVNLHETHQHAFDLFELIKRLLGLQYTVLNPSSVAFSWRSVQSQVSDLADAIEKATPTMPDGWKIHIRAFESECRFLLTLIGEKRAKPSAKLARVRLGDTNTPASGH